MTALVVRSLEECEAVIERGLSTFVEVGVALLEIRDARLYRGTHESFDTYCQERWGWHRAHAYRMIASGEVIGALSPMGDIPKPNNERQARALAPLKSDPEKMADAWSEAVTETKGKPTAAAVTRAVSKRTDRGRLVEAFPNAAALPDSSLPEAMSAFAALGNMDQPERDERSQTFSRWIDAEANRDRDAERTRRERTQLLDRAARVAAEVAVVIRQLDLKAIDPYDSEYDWPGLADGLRVAADFLDSKPRIRRVK